MSSADEKQRPGPIVFTFQWLGVAVVVVAVVAVVVGLVRGDLSGTIGPVVMWGLILAAVGIVAALFQRESRH